VIDREALLRLYRRVLITATHTKPFQDWDAEVRQTISRLAGRADLDHVGVVCYYESEDVWLLIATTEILWRENGAVYHLPIADLSAARVDLRVNRDLGFVPGMGFGWITLVMKDGRERHLKTEAGSAAEAMLSVMDELLRKRGNSG
jgi:hypothetical protein